MWWLLKEQLNIQDFNRVKSRSLHLPHDNMSKDTGCCGKVLYALFLPEKGACLRLSLWEMDSGPKRQRLCLFPGPSQAINMLLWSAELAYCSQGCLRSAAANNAPTRAC